MDWMGLVKTVAPWIGTALTGPLGGIAIGAIAEAMGVEEKTMEAVQQAVAGATPDQLLALKKADQEFAAKMQDMGFKHIEKLQELEVSDRDSARKREMAVGGYSNQWIAGFVILVWAAINVLVFTEDLPPEKEMIIARLLGTMDAALMCVLYYFFGGSRGSDDKNKIISEMVKK